MTLSVADNPTLLQVASLAVAACWLYLECCYFADAATDMFTSSCGRVTDTIYTVGTFLLKSSHSR